MLHLTLRGTPTIYQGEELGMESVPIPPDRVQDPWEKNAPGHGLGRDPVRTPIAWEAGPGAGFTTGELRLPIDGKREISVAQQLEDTGSMLSLYRALLYLRRNEPAPSVGDYETVHVDENVLSSRRSLGDRSFDIALNVSKSCVDLPFGGDLVLSARRAAVSADDRLQPLEGRVFAARI